MSSEQFTKNEIILELENLQTKSEKRIEVF